MPTCAYWIRPSDGETWQIAEQDDFGEWRMYGDLISNPPAEIGPPILPPGHPDLKSDCDLPRVLDLVAAYIAPSQPISYGQMVELLSVVRGCEGWSYSDLYPRLFNVKAYNDPYPGEMALVYDCEAAARALRKEIGSPPEIPALWKTLLDAVSDDHRSLISIIAGERVWRAVSLAATAASDEDAIESLRDLVPAVRALGHDKERALADALSVALGDKIMDLFSAFSRSGVLRTIVDGDRPVSHGD